MGPGADTSSSAPSRRVPRGRPSASEGRCRARHGRQMAEWVAAPEGGGVRPLVGAAAVDPERRYSADHPPIGVLDRGAVDAATGGEDRGRHRDRAVVPVSGAEYAIR